MIAGRRAALAALAILFADGAAPSAAGDSAKPSRPALTVADPWVALAPPGARAHAAYLIVRNPGAETRTIVAAASPDYAGARLHATRIENGVVKMRHVERIEVPPGGAAAFEPGGRHIMLMSPGRVLAEGDSVRILLTLGDGETIAFAAEVKRRARRRMHRHGS